MTCGSSGTPRLEPSSILGARRMLSRRIFSYCGSLRFWSSGSTMARSQSSTLVDGHHPRLEREHRLEKEGEIQRIPGPGMIDQAGRSLMPTRVDRRGRGPAGAVHGQKIRETIVPRGQRLGPGLIQQRQTGEQGEKHELRSGAKHGAHIRRISHATPAQIRAFPAKAARGAPNRRVRTGKIPEFPAARSRAPAVSRRRRFQ